MGANTILHVTVRKKRTTVSMDKVLSALLSLDLQGVIEYAALRQWCQQQIDQDPGAFAGSASQRLAKLAILRIARNDLSTAYRNAQISDAVDKDISRRRK